MYKTLVLDIETVGTSRQDVIDSIAASIKPPATYKKAESIEAWYKEQGPDAIAEEEAKTSLSGAFGQIVCIGYQLDEMECPLVMHGLNELAKRYDKKFEGGAPAATPKAAPAKPAAKPVPKKK